MSLGTSNSKQALLSWLERADIKCNGKKVSSLSEKLVAASQAIADGSWDEVSFTFDGRSAPDNSFQAIMEELGEDRDELLRLAMSGKLKPRHFE